MAHDSGFHYTHHMVKQFLAAYTDSKSGQRGALDILWPRLVDQHNGPRLEETLFRGEDRQVVRAWTLMRVRRGTRDEGRGTRDEGRGVREPTDPCDVWPPVYSVVCGMCVWGGTEEVWQGRILVMLVPLSLFVSAYISVSPTHHSLSLPILYAGGNARGERGAAG